MQNKTRFYITETPRDAMQGWSALIPSKIKADYINQLIKCDFDCIDVGSFVSPKVIPQMADTSEVIKMLHNQSGVTKLMAIAGNLQGGTMALENDKISIVGFPYAVSEVFLKQNLNTNTEKAHKTILDLHSLAIKHNKSLRVYVSMAFGNPYNEPWSYKIVKETIDFLVENGIDDIVYSDTTNEATAEKINHLCSQTIRQFPHLKLGLHLHTQGADTFEKLDAAFQSGIVYYESAVGGHGGCPMTGSKMISNLNTLDLLQFIKLKGIENSIDEARLKDATLMASEIFV